MTEILKPQSSESIYDPTCGSAGMLISSIAYLKKQNLEWRNVSIYGQEINSLSSAIARMNLFLHGIKDFYIVNDDTLKNPGFIERGKLQTFDVVLANPPYSISQWDRTAFESDKYGRNFLGVPPQGRADYAFIQHILKSMDPQSGRSAILLPHGILNRNSEKDMREELVKSGLIESVIGIGKNLFYNSPMEACILICRTKKDKERNGKVLFINAKNEITKKDTFSFLEDKHIEKIVDIYNEFADSDGFSKVVSIEDILKNNSSLSIGYYVNQVNEVYDDYDVSTKDSYEEWMKNSILVDSSMEKIMSLLIGGKDNE
jgi:type I restriction enzyme M protein